MQQSTSKRAETIARLEAAIRRREHGGRPRAASSSHRFHVEPHSLVEWLGDGDGSGVTTLALALGRTASEGQTVLVDESRVLHPPALLEIGLDLHEGLVLRPRDPREAMWAAEQSLRNPAVGLVLWPVDRLRSHQGRRAKLAVERGGGVGLLVRPWRARKEACWADQRFLVSPLPSVAASGNRRWRIEVAYRRGSVPGETFEATLNHETGRVCVVPELAAATSSRRAS